MNRSIAIEPTKNGSLGFKPSDEPPALEADQLVRRCMGSTALASRLLDSFEKRFAAEVAQLVQAIDDGDIPRLVRLTHQLKGASGNVSAMTMHTVLGKMEEAARAQHLDQVVTHLNDLFEQWNRFVQSKASTSLDLAAAQVASS